MSKKCIGCKRELAKHETSCPACGAEQSFFKYHSTSIIALVLIAGGVGYAASRYIDNESLKIKEAVKIEYDKSLQQSQERIDALESELDSTRSQLADANEASEKLKAESSDNSNQADQVLNNLRSKLADAEAEAKKQQGRAGWLGKENARLKTELESLKNQITALQQANESTNASINDNTQAPTEAPINQEQDTQETDNDSDTETRSSIDN